MTKEYLAIEEKNRLYDLQTFSVMKRILSEESNCIDAGCHRGSILREMLRFSPKGTHLAFEPIPVLYRHLVDAFGNLPNVRIYEMALSDSIEEASFQHVLSNPGYSGLHKRRYDRPIEQIQEITVRTNLLDNIVPNSLLIHFIKVDVEGAELQVFKGALKTIKRNRPVIVFEHGLGAADYYGTTPEDIFDLLVGACDLRLSLMTDWLESSGRSCLSKDAFSEQFWSGRNYYFIAHP